MIDLDISSSLEQIGKDINNLIKRQSRPIVTIDDIVRDCITQHEGGESFFDALDEHIRNTANIWDELKKLTSKLLVRRLGVTSLTITPTIIVSGRFGAILANHSGFDTDWQIIAVEGGLRNSPFSGFGEHEHYITNRYCIFVDDSFYLGRTRDKIKKEVERIGGKFIGTVVAYDGSKELEKDVLSLYRYYK